MSSPQRPIRLLPPALADRIAAGEVVERPASVVKELVENSLDAGAARIRVDLENGGLGLIRVSDDGRGLPPDEMPLAVARHATSKLAQGDDLLAIGSFGFRGEALASIASVARLTLSSARADGPDGGAQVRVEHGRMSEVIPAALPGGTTVEVRDLFGSVPARRKFLKTNATEVRRCQEVLARMSLAHPRAGFTLTSDGRTLFSFPPGQTLVLRLASLWPPAITEHLEPFEAALGSGPDAYRAHGLAGPPSVAQARGDRIYTYVANRPVQDRILTSAVRQAYKGRLVSREHPVAVIFLETPQGAVDVNVHPAKLEVRFRDESAVFAVVRRGISQALAAADPLLGKRPEPISGQNSGRGLERDGIDLTGILETPPRAAPPQPAQQRLNITPASPAPSKWEEPPRANRVAEAVVDWGTPPAPPGTAPESGPELEPEIEENHILAAPLGLPPGVAYLGQVADTYLILRLPGGELGLLDQHAAHERVLYARYAAAGKRPGRPLAVPVSLALHPAEEARALELWTDLQELGFSLSHAGPGVLEMSAAPGELTAGQAKELLAEILAGETDGRDNMWQMYACRAALKAGEPLAAAEALALIGEWAATPDREHCPHGRPALVRLSGRELEKLFKRS